MKILWFSNTASLYSDKKENKVSKGTGNWISSLEKQIRDSPNLELGIAFHKNKNKNLLIVKNGNVKYFVLPSKYTNKFGKLYNNWFGKVDNVYEVDYYFKVIELFKPDVIHIFGFENSFVKILPKYKHLTIIHIQGIYNVYLHFFNGNFNSKELEKHASLLNKIKGSSYIDTSKKFKERAVIESGAFMLCRYLFGRTDWDRAVAKAVAPQAKYFHCQEIMRDEFYHENWQKPRREELVFFTTLDDRPYKGPDQIFHIDSILQKYRPSLKYRWRIAGLDEKSMCIIAMRKRGFKKSLRLLFLGRLSANEIIEEMQQSDIFVYPSFIENGCNAVQEAMLVGMPIVCTSAGGMATTITNNETGLLVQPGDPYAMAGIIIELIEDYELAKNLGNNARLVAHKRHDKEKIVNTVISTYRTIINN
jgi:glycosyltransferase involved in cell wall biosynthesis